MLNLLRPVLVLLVGYLLRLALVALGVELDEATFNAIVGAIVVYLLALLGVDAAESRLRGTRFEKYL